MDNPDYPLHETTIQQQHVFNRKLLQFHLKDVCTLFRWKFFHLVLLCLAVPLFWSKTIGTWITTTNFVPPWLYDHFSWVGTIISGVIATINLYSSIFFLCCSHFLCLFFVHLFPLLLEQFVLWFSVTFVVNWCHMNKLHWTELKIW